MKTKKFSVLFLMAAIVFAIAAAFTAQVGPLASARAEEDDVQEVRSLSVVVQFSSANGLYVDMIPYTLDHGYGEVWSESLTDMMESITINGKTLNEANVPFQAAGQQYRMHFGAKDNPFVAGDKIVIPEGLVWNGKDGKSLKFCCEFTITFDGDRFVIGAKSDNVPEYVVDSVIPHPHSNGDNSKIMFSMSDMEGNPCYTGYTQWVSPDGATEELEKQLTVNGENMAEVNGVSIQGMDVANMLCISGYYLPDGGEIVIPEGAVYNNGMSKITFGRTFTIRYVDGIYEVERSDKEIVFPEYDMPEGMLSDFTSSSVFRLGGQSFTEAAVNDTEGYWLVNYKDAVSGAFVDADEAPEGSTNGGYKFYWETTKGLYYPSIMFKFRDDVNYSVDDELVIRIYFSETLDSAFTLWATSSLNPKIWEAETSVSGLSLNYGDWNEIRLSIGDYADENGKIAPIAFTLNYGSAYSVAEQREISGGYLLFDTATVVETVKVLKDDYTVSDVSEIVPVGDGKEFRGEFDELAVYDWDKGGNIAFARTDKSVDGIKAKITVSDTDAFSMYFVLNGNGTYYLKGGIYYWLTNEGVKVGTASRVYVDEPLPASVKSGREFTMEMLCVPFYVDGMKSGNYVLLRIDGEDIGEGKYISGASCNFGNWFGLYLHDTTKDVGVRVSPVAKSDEDPINLTLTTSLNATAVKVKDTLGTRVKVSGKIYGAEEVKYEVVSGADCASVDDKGYISGLKDGEAVIRASVTNPFGTFYSNEVRLTVGKGGASQPSSGTDSSGEVAGNGGGCGSSAGGIGLLSAAVLGAAALLIGKKRI